MNEMTVDEFINIIGYCREYVLNTIDFIGELNKHLKNTYNDFKRQFYFIDRTVDGVELKGNEIIYGDYLLFDYCGHSGDMILFDEDSLFEIEEHITGGAGITNPFATSQIAIIHGKKKEYEIFGIDKNDHKEIVFDKDDFIYGCEFERMVEKVEIRWLS